MNAVEIEQGISELVQQPFDAAEFPFTCLAVFGHKDTTLKRLRTGNDNASDVPGDMLLRKATSTWHKVLIIAMEIPHPKGAGCLRLRCIDNDSDACVMSFIQAIFTDQSCRLGRLPVTEIARLRPSNKP